MAKGMMQRLAEAAVATVEVVKDGLAAAKESGGKVWDFGQDMGLAKGASEIAAVLYTSSAFVQYGNHAPEKESMADIQAGGQALAAESQGKEAERGNDLEM